MRPAVVFIDAVEDQTQCWRDWQAVNPAAPQIEILPSEPLSGIDLRCIVGLTVILSGPVARRVDAVRQACLDAGAVRVVAAVVAAGAVSVVDTRDKVAV
jgi:hypothetical protein